jgi:hypothetical protein
MNADIQYWDIKQRIKDVMIVSLLFFIPGSFVVSYWLYPFKMIKRNKVLIWVLSIISLLITGVVTLVEIAHFFSDM